MPLRVSWKMSRLICGSQFQDAHSRGADMSAEPLPEDNRKHAALNDRFRSLLLEYSKICLALVSLRFSPLCERQGRSSSDDSIGQFQAASTLDCRGCSMTNY